MQGNISANGQWSQLKEYAETLIRTINIAEGSQGDEAEYIYNEKRNEALTDLIIQSMMFMLPSIYDGYDDETEVFTDGSEILCRHEVTAEIIADFIQIIVKEFSGIDIHTGYYDPYEDAKSGETDAHTGFYYIDFD